MAAAPPAPTTYHRTMGWHASALRRLAVAGGVGLVVMGIAAPFLRWPLPILIGWDVACLLLILSLLHLIIPSDGPTTQVHAQADDDTRREARAIVVVIALVSLLAVAWALHTAKISSGGTTGSLLVFASLTVLFSWTAVNATFTLHYAHLYYRDRGHDIDFQDTDMPDYRDMAYLAFTIGMTYQVSDTALKSKAMRRAVLWHALIAYVFGVVIVATVVNIVATYL